MRFPAIYGKQALRQALEECFENQASSRLDPFENPDPERISTGIEAVDRLSNGLPRGRIVEIVGPDSCGRTTLLLSILSQIIDKEEVCGLIDPAGTFDPVSAVQMGIDLERLLWIRASRPDIDPTLKVTDLLLAGGTACQGGFQCPAISSTTPRRSEPRASTGHSLAREIVQPMYFST